MRDGSWSEAARMNERDRRGDSDFAQDGGAGIAADRTAVALVAFVSSADLCANKDLRTHTQHTILLVDSLLHAQYMAYVQ